MNIDEIRVKIVYGYKLELINELLTENGLYTAYFYNGFNSPFSTLNDFQLLCFSKWFLQKHLKQK